MPSGSTRIQVDISKGRDAEINKLIKECGSPTKSAFVKSAISFFTWALEESRKGNKIASINGNAQKVAELMMTEFDEMRIKFAETESQ